MWRDTGLRAGLWRTSRAADALGGVAALHFVDPVLMIDARFAEMRGLSFDCASGFSGASLLLSCSCSNNPWR